MKKNKKTKANATIPILPSSIVFVTKQRKFLILFLFFSAVILLNEIILCMRQLSQRTANNGIITCFGIFMLVFTKMLAFEMIYIMIQRLLLLINTQFPKPFPKPCKLLIYFRFQLIMVFGFRLCYKTTLDLYKYIVH